MAEPIPSQNGAALQGTTASTQAPGQGESGGLPQFNPTWWAGQMIWLAVIFAVLYVLLWKVLLPKVAGAIDTREGRIAGDIADARRLKDEAEAQAAAAAAEMAEARTRAQKLGADAKARAAAQAAQRQAAEEAKLNVRLAAAEAETRTARDLALGNVHTIAMEAAQAIVEKLTGQAASAADVEAAMAAE
jgi:F-type H+-transporting ATPase subunit b